MDKVLESLDEIVDYIKTSRSYKNCLKIRKLMDENEELMKLINKLKSTQKKYVNTNFSDETIKKELDKLEEKLNVIPIYTEYNNNIEEVNLMIETVKDELNFYFEEKINILK